MTDSEMEIMCFAAKAYGANYDYRFDCFFDMALKDAMAEAIWSPRTDDGDAFRLMVKLNLNVFHVMDTAYAMESETELTGEHTVRHRNDPAAATREAIFQAAVAIGQAMP